MCRYGICNAEKKKCFGLAYLLQVVEDACLAEKILEVNAETETINIMCLYLIKHDICQVKLLIKAELYFPCEVECVK